LKRKTRVYVAARSEDRALARQWMDRLREAGLEITHDWVPDVERYMTTEAMASREERIRHSELDVQGVITADVLWVLMPAESGAGVHTELGIALGWNLASAQAREHDGSGGQTFIVVSGALSRNIFASLAHEGYETHEEAFESVKGPGLQPRQS